MIGGYAARVGAGARRIKRSQLYEWLRLKGYVAFNLPRLVTTLGAALLMGIAGVHIYVLISRPALPTYFAVYTAAVAGCCLLTAVALWLARNPRVPQAAWLFGDLFSVVFLCLYLVSRAVTLPGLVAVDRAVGFRTRDVCRRVRIGLYRSAYVGATGDQRGIPATSTLVRLTGLPR